MIKSFKFISDPDNDGAITLKRTYLSETSLTASNKYVTELDSITLPTTIKEAHFSENFIDKFPDFHCCEFLTHVDLSCNAIKTLNGSDLPPHIQVLNLSYNNITEFPCLTTVETLKELNLSSNSITTFTCHDLPPCTEVLKLSSNKVKNFPCLTTCENLKTLNLSWNFIKEVPEDVFPVSTEEVYLNHNQIEYIHALPPNISKISLENNPIRAFGGNSFPSEAAFASVRNGLSFHQLSALLQPLPDDFMKGYNHVISNCQFDKYNLLKDETILNYTYRGASEKEVMKLFDSNSKYEIVDVSGNKLQHADSFLPSLQLNHLKYLLLSDTKLENIDGTLIPDSTEVLWLDQNHLKGVPLLSEKKQLVNVNLSGNSLCSVEVHNFPSTVECINLSCNNITTAPDVSSLTSLRELNLSYNKIKDIPDADQVLNCAGLEYLSIDNNKLVSVPVLIQNNSLKVIDLSSNLIQDIPSLLFPVDVETIMLQYNLLETIPDLSACKHLHKLILSNNQIKEASVECLPVSLTELCLNNNNLDYLPYFEKFARLRLLNVQCNKIHTVKGLPPQISELFLYGNPVRVLCRECFPDERMYNIVVLSLVKYKSINAALDDVVHEYRLFTPPDDIFELGFTSVIAYYSTKHTSTVHSQSYLENSRNRFIVVGDTEAGKSSLVTSLMNKTPTLTAIANRTQVVDIVMWNITEKDIYQVFDQGGHPIYAITNPLFMSKVSNILIAHDLRKIDQKSVWSTIGFFRNTMQQQPNSKINFALTHIDCVDTLECKERCASFESSVKTFVRDEINSLTIILETMRDRQKNISSLNFADKSVVELLLSYKKKLSGLKFYPVSSRTFKGIEELWQYLADEAKGNRRIIPQKWVKLYSLMTEKPKYFFQYQVLEQMFKELYSVMQKLKGKTKMVAELKDCLNYFSDSGLVIWEKEDPVLCEYVFHNLVFLVSVLKSLFHHDLEAMLDYDTVTQLQLKFSKDELERDVSLYQNEGLLSHKLMSHLLEQYKINSQEISAILGLLETFKLCFKISSSQENMLYFFPWFVQNSDPPQASVSRYSKNSVSLGFECFFLNKIPINVFERLCVKLQELAVNKHYLGERYAWKDGFRVTLDRCECQIERQEDSSALFFSVICPVADLQEGWQNLTFLQKLVESTLQVFFGVIKSFYVVCTHCTMKRISPPHRRSQSEVWPKIKHKSAFVRCPFEPGENIPSALIVATQTKSNASITEAIHYVEQNWIDQTQGPQLPAQERSLLLKQKAKLCLTMHVEPVIDILFSKGELSNAQKLELGGFLKHQQIDYLVNSVIVKGSTALDSLKSALDESCFYINQMLSKFICCEDFEDNNAVFLIDTEVAELQRNFYQNFMDYANVEELIPVMLSGGTIDKYHSDELSAKVTVRQKASYLLDHVLFRGTFETVQRFKDVLLETQQLPLAEALPIRT